MEIIILGSSGAIPTKDRNLPATALKLDSNSETILFDCGEDTQRRFIDAGLKLNKPLVICISHFHGDHINGLPGLLFRFSLIDRKAPLILIGPRNLFLYLYFHKKTVGLGAKYPLTVIEIDNQSKKLFIFEGLDSEVPKKEEDIVENIIYQTRNYKIKYTLVEHSIPTYAYAFIEDPRPGKFNPERARDLGIPESVLWRNLQMGECIDFKGKVIDPEEEDIIGPKRPGRKITYSGDTMPCESLIHLGMDSDVLIHESTFSALLAETAIDKKHSTSVDAANAAVKMNVKQLILTHISSRYQEDASFLLEEAKEIFPNSILAEDLLKITLK